MDREKREEALGRALRIVRAGARSTEFGGLIANGLVAEHEEVVTLRSEVARLTAALDAKAPRLTDEQQLRALDKARWLMGREDAGERETMLAQGLIDARGEADRLGAALGEVAAFLTQHALAADPRNVLANALIHIEQIRRAQ